MGLVWKVRNPDTYTLLETDPFKHHAATTIWPKITRLSLRVFGRARLWVGIEHSESYHVLLIHYTAPGVDTPSSFLMPYEDITLTTKDKISLHCYLIQQKSEV